MKYFIDTEFIEGSQSTWWGSKTKPTIDLISIGIVREDTITSNGLTVKQGYYAISKDFNLKEAWNRYDIKKEWYSIDESTQSTRDVKVYWIRENVLYPIFLELATNNDNEFVGYSFTYKLFKHLVNKYGKTNKQIAQEVKEFIYAGEGNCCGNADKHLSTFKAQPEFYGYYSDYDWVVFCWLFGRMLDLPKGFPMYCIDLKQIMDEKITKWRDDRIANETKTINFASWETYERALKNNPNYPKQSNKHNAWDDALWNYELYKFLTTL